MLPDPMLPDDPMLPEDPMLPDPMLLLEPGEVLEPVLLDWAKTATGASATTAPNAHTSSFFIVDPPDCAFEEGSGWSVLHGATLLPLSLAR